jgi:hypothetical protein
LWWQPRGEFLSAIGRAMIGIAGLKQQPMAHTELVL